MDRSAIKQLRLFGILALALGMIGLLLLLSKGGEIDKLDASTLILTLTMMGIGLLVIAEIGPFIQSFKAGDIEATFFDSTGAKFLKLEERVAKLEQQAATAQTFGKAEATIAETKQAPALQREKTVKNDQWKGRFGGKETVKDFRLRAEFRMLSSRYAEISLFVEYFGQGPLSDKTCAEFYLHQSFDPWLIPARFESKKNGAVPTAGISVSAWGGFTVGVWLPVQEVELELDLSMVPKAPRIIKEL